MSSLLAFFYRGVTPAPPPDPEPPTLPTAPPPLRSWSFSETSGGWSSDQGDLLLTAPAGSSGEPLRVDSPYGGGALRFNGSQYVQATDPGVLNIGKRGLNTVTVSAWVRRSGTGQQFIAGCWQEGTPNPQRQYATFVNLPMYGAPQKALMHVSKNGAPTPGYPYSIDYAVFPDPVPVGTWTHVVGTYDGQVAKTYANGKFKEFTGYSPTKYNDGKKNPYTFPDGLNDIDCPFTVGSALFDNGTRGGNFMQGDIAAVQVWDQALTAPEVAGLYARERQPGDPPPPEAA